MSKNKLQRTAESLEYIRRILTNSIWIIIIVVLLAGLGWLVSQTVTPSSDDFVAEKTTPQTKPVIPEIDWQAVDASLVKAMKSAREDARTYATAELGKWVDELMMRVDDSFLDWYFNYWTQQLLGLKGLYQYGVHYVIESQPSASEKLTEEIQSEFASRVLRPQIAEKTLERIIQQTATLYINSLQYELESIPAQYGIRSAEWQQYLEDIALTTKASPGGRQTPLSLKALAVSGTGGALLLSASMKGLVTKVGSKVMTKSSGKVASAMAAKTGGKVVAKVGGKFFGKFTGIGVLIWDLWDHRQTQSHNRPHLRQTLQDYLTELKLLLLDDPEYGVMATLHDLERQVTAKEG